jgi:replicative DNA helicase
MTTLEKENGILDLYADNSELFIKCENLVFDDLWSTNINKERYKIAKANHNKGVKTDVLLMSNSLIKLGYTKSDIKSCLGKPDYLLEKNIFEYVKDLFDEYVKRTMKPILHQKYRELNSEIADVATCLDELKNSILEIDSIKNNLTTDRSILDIFDEFLEDLVKNQENKSEVMGYSWGIKELDRITGGAKQEVILCLGAPAMGKTSLMVNGIKHIGILQDKPMVVFSLEVSGRKLMSNIVANVLEINSYGIRNGKLSDDNFARVVKFKDRLKENITIDDTPGITWQYMEARIKRERIKKKIPIEVVMVVFIDYVQIMRNTPEETKGINEEQQQSMRANGLLEMSKRQNLCLVEFSQMGREAIKTKKEPTMQDAKGSGAWEANSDQTWGLFRPEYHDKDAMEDGVSLKGLGKIIILKNRYGDIGSVLVKFIGHHSAFENYNPEGLSANNDSEAF